MLLPPSLNEWLPDGHLAYFISDAVEELDLSAFYARYEGSGRRNSPFDPRMMLKVLIYAYATGTFSSRKIARKLEEDWLSKEIDGLCLATPGRQKELRDRCEPLPCDGPDGREASHRDRAVGLRPA